MDSSTAYALTAFIAWALLLLVLMEVMRTHLVVSKVVPPNGFVPDNANLSPFMQRLARAHANCVESLPIFGGLMLVAIVTQQTAVTDPFAWALVIARLVQSLAHLWSLSNLAVSLRFSAFAIQMVIAVIWAVKLLA